MPNTAAALQQSELVLGRYRPLQAARKRRIRVGLARPRRAERPGRGPEDHSARGEGGLPGRARGGGCGPAAPPGLPTRLRLRTRLPARLHRLRVRPGTNVPRGSQERRARRPLGDRSVCARCWRRSRTRTSEASCIATSSRRTSCWPKGKGVSARVLDFGLAQDARGRDADRAGRRAGDARLHRAGTARRWADHRRRRTSGRWG